VKTGLAIAAGGATERFGLEPDLVTLAKTLGGGLPSGAIGGTDEVMSYVTSERVYQVGTYNGNPLTMAAARASLERVLTPDAYLHLDRLNDRIVGGCQAVIDRHGLPGYAIGVGSKGCVTFAPAKITDYESFKEHQDVELCELAWLWNLNRGIFMTPGREEEWTLSVTHTDADVDHFVAVFEDISGRKRAEERTRRKAAVLEGIARVFHETLTSRSEEELGRTCLAVAEAVTRHLAGRREGSPESQAKSG